MRELSLGHVAAFVIISCGLATAQQTGTTGTTTTTTTPTTTTPTTTTPTTGTGGTTTGAGRGTTSTTTPQAPRLQQPIFLSGTVTMPDGTEPPERVLIERLCSTNRARPEGYTDSKGHFSFQVGSNQIVADASEGFFGDPTNSAFSNSSTTSNTSSTMSPLADCELRAKLPGYRSTSIFLAGHLAMDNPNVGTLVIFPLSKEDGLSISATSASAPKDAKKALDKGVSEARKQKFDSAEKELRKAVNLHPKYAEAWLELGKVYAAKKNFDAAREALNHGVEADPKFVYPYEELYKIAFEQASWQELADLTNKLLRLNPYEFPAAFYYNGVANLQLRNFDEAQRSLQQAIEADKRRSNPKALYVMGLVLIQKRDYPGATQALSDFAQIAPSDPTIPKVRTLLDELQKLQ